jgi:hypothetical protein
MQIYMINFTGHRKVRIAGELEKNANIFTFNQVVSVLAPGQALHPASPGFGIGLRAGGCAQAHSSVSVHALVADAHATTKAKCDRSERAKSRGCAN